MTVEIETNTEVATNIPFKEVESIEGTRTYFIPGCRRGPLTANNVLSLVDSVKRYGAPKEVVVVPIPGVTDVKYFHNLINGLPHDVQLEAATLVTAGEYPSGRYTPHIATDVPLDWSGFTPLIERLASRVNTELDTDAILDLATRNESTQHVNNLADCYAVWDAAVLKHSLERHHHKEVDVTVELPSLNTSRIEYRTGYLSNRGSNGHEPLFPEQLTRRLAKRTRAICVDGILRACIAHDEERIEKSSRTMRGSVEKALRVSDWQAIRDNVNPQPERLKNHEGTVSRAIYTYMLGQEESAIETPDFRLLQTLSDREVSHRFVMQYLAVISEPAGVFREADAATRPRNFNRSVVRNGDTPIDYYSGADVLTYALRGTERSGSTMIMQDLDRTEMLDAALERSGVDPQKIGVVYAEPEDAFPMRDQSIFLLHST